MFHIKSHNFFPGSAAIDLAMVAAGQADLYFQSGIHCWDIAAGALLVKEAGGTVLDPSGGEFDFMSRGILVAATDNLAQEFVQTGIKVLPFEAEYPEKCPL